MWGTFNIPSPGKAVTAYLMSPSLVLSQNKMRVWKNGLVGKGAGHPDDLS